MSLSIFLYKNVKIADTTLFLYKNVKTADYTFSYLVSTISKHYTFPIQKCQNCGLHFFLSSVHYIKIQQIHYTNMPKLRTTLFLI